MHKPKRWLDFFSAEENSRWKCIFFPRPFVCLLAVDKKQMSKEAACFWVIDGWAQVKVKRDRMQWWGWMAEKGGGGDGGRALEER